MRALGKMLLACLVLVGFCPQELQAQVGDMPCEVHHVDPGDVETAAPGGGGSGAMPDRPWTLGIHFNYFSFDEFEGTDLDDLGVEDASLLRSVVRWGIRTPYPSAVSIDFPIYQDLDFETTAGDLSEEGPGDIVVRGLYVHHRRGGRSWISQDGSDYHGIEGRLSLPTGDEDDALGIGDVTAYVGWRGRIGRQAGGPDRLTTAFTPGAGYHVNFGDSDLNAFILNLPVIFGFGQKGDKGIQFGLNWYAETGDGPENGSRDEISAVNAFFNYQQFFDYNDSARPRWLFNVGVGRQLDDDGLREDLTAHVGFTYRWVD